MPMAEILPAELARRMRSPGSWDPGDLDEANQCPMPKRNNNRMMTPGTPSSHSRMRPITVSLL
jgi:hypothetical protein